ncbi:MAG: cellulose biosynthesis cyclic di-GMP-binding regulatory protein BcsB [Lachnospiraceae bacterium]|nr:cellulose biosynthesis cyclic di-GMP-binding regulatory protein BcsB [Lachnospiraceae bacterium]
MIRRLTVKKLGRLILMILLVFFLTSPIIKANADEDDEESVVESDETTGDEDLLNDIDVIIDGKLPERAGTVMPEVPETEYTKVFEFERDYVFSGIYKASGFYFEVEDYWDTQYVYATIEYTISPLVTDNVPATLTFLVNDIPVGSCRVLYDDGRTQTTYVVIPVEYLKEGFNNFSITGYVRLYDDQGCLDDFSGANWINIRKDSNISAFYDLKEIEDYVCNYPYPFASTMDEQGDSCGIYMSNDPSEAELKAALYLRADIGDKTDERDNITLGYVSAMDRENRIIVGRKDRLPKEVLANMPSRDEDLGKGALVYVYRDDKGYVLVVTSENDEYLYEGVAMLMDETRVSQERDSSAYVPAGVAADLIKTNDYYDSSAIRRLSDLTGTESINFVGPFHQTETIYLPYGGGFVLAAGGKMTLNFRYSENLDFTRSLITVYWGQTPIASKKLSREKAGDDTFSFAFPQDIVGSSEGSLTIAFDLEIEDMYCLKRIDEMPWAHVSGDSTIFLPVGQNNKFSLDLRPYPFQLMGYFNDLDVIIPDEITDSELELLGRVITIMGSDINPYGDFRVSRASQYKSGSNYNNRIVIGNYVDNAYIRKINEDLSFKYNAAGTTFESNEALVLSEDYGANIGVLQIIRNPAKEGSAIMVVSGVGDDDTVNMLEFLREEENCYKLTGDAFMIDDIKETKDFTFIKEKVADKKTIKERISENKEAVVFTLVYTLAMILLFVAVLLILIRTVKNRRQNKKE